MVKKFAIKQPKPQATTMYFWAIATTTSFRLYLLNTTLATSISTARNNNSMQSMKKASLKKIIIFIANGSKMTAYHLRKNY